MMLRTIILYLVTLIFLFEAKAQNKSSDLPIYNQPNQLVEQLANGTILVRLNTGEKQLELLEKMKLTKKLTALKKEIEEENIKIIDAFSEKLTYASRVYFFKSSDSPKIKSKAFSGNLFDKNGNRINEEEKPIGTYVIAEFAKTEEMGIPALVISDDQFNQLKPPFPYFVRTFESLPVFNRSYERTVELFDEKLRTYHKFHSE